MLRKVCEKYENICHFQPHNNVLTDMTVLYNNIIYITNIIYIIFSILQIWRISQVGAAQLTGIIINDTLSLLYKLD